MNRSETINKIKSIISKQMCEYENCTDSYGKQYPDCEIINNNITYYRCPLSKFKTHEISVEIYETLMEEQ